MIDVGASNGVCSKHFEGKVYAFEPCPKNFKQLQRLRTDLYQPIQKAIDIQNGVTTFYESNYTNSSSLLKFSEEGLNNWKCPSLKGGLETIKSYYVETIRLDTFLDSVNHKGQIDFIKIDAQGNDFNVIKSLGKYLQDVLLLQCEVQITKYELYKNSSDKTKVQEYMQSKGFQLVNVKSWSSGQEEELMFKTLKHKNGL